MELESVLASDSEATDWRTGGLIREAFPLPDPLPTRRQAGIGLFMPLRGRSLRSLKLPAPAASSLLTDAVKATLWAPLRSGLDCPNTTRGVLLFCLCWLWRFKAEDDLIGHDFARGELRADDSCPVALAHVAFINFLLVVLELGLA